MDILYLLIPLSLIIVIVIIWAFLWSVRSGQFDDLEGPAHRILMDNDGMGKNKDRVGENKGRSGEETSSATPGTEKSVTGSNGT